MAKHSYDNSILVVSSCAIVFALFVFLFLFFLEAGTLEMTQHVLSGGATHYNRTIGAIIITLVLFLVQLFTKQITHLYGGFYSLSYFPSILLLAILTIVNPNFSSIPFYGFWFWLFPLLMLIYIGFVYIYRKNNILNSSPITKGRIIRYVWINLLVLTLMFSLVSALASSNKASFSKTMVESLSK